MDGPLGILQKVRQQLEARGARTVRSLGQLFKHMDYVDGNRKLDKGEFLVGLREIGIQITEQEVIALMKVLDKNGDGNIDFDEFLVGIRGKPNAKRQAMIDKAFLKFDRDGNGVITAADMKGVYNAKMHPKVQNGTMTEEQVFLEFLSHFGDVNKDGTLTRAEWNDYYAAVSASIDNDDHFVLLMKNAWKLD